MRLLLLLLLPALGFAQPTFRAEFNFLVSETPVEGGEYRLKGLFSDGDALGFGVDSVKAGYFFYDSKGFLYEIVYSNGLQPLTIEVDKVNHSAAPTTGTGIITNVTVNIDLPFETSKLSGKLRSVIEVDTRLKLDSSYLVDLGRLTDVDTTGKTDGSIILYDATSGNWEAQANSIDNLTDGYKFNGNIVLGRPFVRKPTSVDYANIYLGVNAGPDSLLGYGNIAIGQDVFRSFTADPVSQGNGNIAIGAQAMNKTLTGFQNVAIGRNAFKGNLTGSDNVAIGRGAGYNNFGDPDNILTNYNQGIFIGTHAAGLDTFSTNEIAIGYNVVGNGSNTATLGNNNITATYLKGTTNLRGYGLGNREASDLGKTGSGYFLEVATDGTLVESVSAGGGVSNLGALTDVDTTGKTDGSIILYNETVGEWQAQANSINNLTDAFFDLDNQNNLLIGDNTIIPVIPGPNNNGNLGFGTNLYRQFNFGNENIIAGISPMYFADSSSRNVAIGKNSAGGLATGQSLAIKNNHNNSIFIGQFAGALDTFSYNSVVIGNEANLYYPYDLATNTSRINNSVIIGGFSKSGSKSSLEEIVIGANTTGNGDSTVTIGRSFYKGTYLNGNLNLNGYGLGNKEASDLSKTGSGYFLEVATDGTLIESQVTGDVQLTDLSVLVNSAGLANLEYDNTTGVFTYTPPDLSSYLTSEVDGSTTNELQDLSLAGNLLSLSGSSATVDLSGYLDNTDAQEISLASNILSISGAASTVNLSPYLDNTNIATTDLTMSGTGGTRTADFTGNTLNIVNETSVINIGEFDVLNENTSLLRLNNSSNTTILQGTNVLINGQIQFSDYGNGDFVGLSDEAYILATTNAGYIREIPLDEYLTAEVDGSTTNELQTLSFNDATRQLTLSDDGTIDLSEGIQDEIAATLVQGEGISLTYDDGAGTLTIAAPSGAGNTDEQTLSINSATAELSISNGNTVDLSEAIDAQVNTLFVDGTNIQSTYDDGANTLTVRTTDALTQIDAITFDDNTAATLSNVLQYNPDYETFVFGSGVNNTPVYIGQDMGWFVKNETGTTIAKGTPVYASGTDGNSGKITVAPMIADGSINAKYFLGVTAESIANGANGFVWTMGKIRGVNLSAFNDGDVLYVSSASAGTFVNTSPSAPNLKLPVGFVVSDNSNGTLAVRATVGSYLSESHDVQIASASNGEVLKFDGSKWVDGTDLVDDADADPTNEIQTMTATNGLSVSATGNDYEYRWGGNLSQATTVDGLDSYNILFDNLTSFTTNVVNDVRLNAESVAYGNNSSLIFDDFTGASITNTGTTNQYTSSLNMLRSGELSLKQDRTYASEQLSQGLTIAAADATLKLFSNSVTNSTSTSINLSPDEVKLITPNVFATTATTGQFLQLTDGATGTVEFADALTAEVDGSVTNEIQDLSLTGNTLSLSSDATTVDLSPYLDDQTVTLTGGGITAISGTYPNFTITSTEVDGSVTNEIQDLSLTGNTLSLSSDATTVDLSPYLDESTTASNGLTLSGTDVKLGGTLSESTVITINNNVLNIGSYGTDITSIKLQESTGDIFTQGKFNFRNSIGFYYGTGNSQAGNFGVTQSPYLAGFATNGTFIEVPISSLGSGSITASNGLTKSGDDIKLGGTLTEITNIAMAGFNASIYDVSSNTGFAIQPSSNLIVNYGTQAFDDYGSGNKEAADLSKTKSNYKAAFATDGTLIEYDDIDAMVVACSDETTDITTGTAKVTFRAPHAMTITGVRASLTTASSSGNPTVDINEGGTSILGTKLTIDANEKTSTTAATAATITDTAIADDAEITIDIDAAGTGAKGLKVTILYRK